MSSAASTSSTVPSCAFIYVVTKLLTLSRFFIWGLDARDWGLSLLRSLVFVSLSPRKSLTAHPHCSVRLRRHGAIVPALHGESRPLHLSTAVGG